jgi:putative transposase
MGQGQPVVAAILEHIPLTFTHPTPSSPGLTRRSTPCFVAKRDVDGRDKHGHDDSSRAGRALIIAVPSRPGGCWFFTVNLLDRRRRLLTDNIDALREATRLTQTRHPFTIDAMVVLPRYIHAVWTLPPGDTDFSLLWRLIKNRLHHGHSQDPTAKPGPHCARRARRQRRFWEHLIHDDEDFRRHVEFCYINPVKHGLVTRVRD